MERFYNKSLWLVSLFLCTIYFSFGYAQQSGKSTGAAAGTILVWEGVLGGQDYSGAYINNYLTTAGFTVDYQSTFPSTLSAYNAVFLSFGNSGPDGSSKTTLSASDAATLRSYLETGGKVYLEGGDALGKDQAGNTVLYGLFGLIAVADGTTNAINQLSGQSGTLAQGISFTGSSQVNNDFIDKYTPFGGSKAFVESGYGTVGVQYIGVNGQRTFCLSYALENLTDGSGVNTRDNLMAQLVNFFELGSTSGANISVTPDTIALTLKPGASTTRTVTISNTGSSTLTWEMSGQNGTAVELQLDDRRSLPVSLNRPTAKETPQLSNLLTGEYAPFFKPPDSRTIAEARLSSNSAGGNVSLVIDDGGRENGVGLLAGGQFIWLNQFSPQSGEFPFTLNEVQILFGSGLGVNAGDLVDIFVYEDTDGNLDNGATLRNSLTNASVQAVDDQTFSVYSFPGTTFNGPGDVIIAVVNRTAGITAGDLPAALDQSNNASRSWIGTYSGDPSGAPALPATNLWGKTGTLGFPGNWMIRGVGVSANDCPWLSETPGSGSISAGFSQDVIVQIDATGLALGVYNCNLVITSNDADTPQIIIPVTLTVKNLPPVISNITNQIVDEAQTLQVSLSATDQEGDILSFSVENLPTFGSLSDNGDGSGTLTFSPGVLDAGIYNTIRVIVSDDGAPALLDTTEFTLTVNNVNQPPTLTNIPDQTVKEFETLVTSISASDIDTSDVLTLSASNLPAFAVFSDNGNGSGSITFTPDSLQAGSYPNITVTATDDATPPHSVQDIFTLTVVDSNRAPILTAIADQSVDENGSLTVSLSAGDPDTDNSLAFSTVNLPSFATLTDSGNGSGSIAFAPGFSDAGSTSITVIVTDNSSNPKSAQDVFTLTVNNVNRSPVISALVDTSLSEGETLVVALSASDPDANGLSFSATNLPSFATLTDNGDGSGIITFSPNFLQSGVYPNIQIKVTDDDPAALSDSSSFQLTVQELNRAPVLSAIPAQSVTEAETLSVAISASDPDTDNSLTLSAANLPTFATFTDNGNGSGSIVFTPGLLEAGSYPNITVTATDDAASPLSDQQIFTLTVVDSNRAPILTAIADQSVDENGSLTVSLSASDPDTDNSLAFSATNLPSFATLTDNGNGSGSIAFAPGFFDAGSYSITVIVTDNSSNPKSAQDVFTLTVNNVNRAPVITALVDTSLMEGETLAVALSASDPDTNGLGFSATNLPSFATLTDNGDGSGTLTFSPNFIQAGVYPNIQIKVTDGDPAALSDSTSFQLTVQELNRAPVLTAIPAQSVTEAETLSVAITATDPDADNSLTLSAANLPTFATFTDNGNGSGSIVFSPGLLHAGSYPNITVTATDDAASPLSDQQIFTLTVVDSNRAPTLTAIANQAVDENGSLTILLSASDVDTDNSLAFATVNLPAFATLTDNGNGSGSIAFAPGFADAGSTSITVIVTDDAPTPKSAQDVFTLTVNNVNRAPVMTQIADTSLMEGQTLSVHISASDPDGNGLTLAVSNLPVFSAFLDNGDGSGTLTFSPNFTQSGVYGNIKVKVTDNDPAALSDSTSFQLTVQELNRAPVLTAIPAQSMPEAGTLSVAISASDPDTDNSLTLSAANLPAFATFTDNGNGNGSIVFTPDFLQAGSYPNITVTVTDNAVTPLSDQQIFTLTVVDSNRAPTLAAIADQSVDENNALTVSLSAGDLDSDNSLTFSVSNLPTFAAFTDSGNGGGSIAFAPGFFDAGSYANIIVTVTDDAPTPKSAQDAFTLTVNNVNRAPVVSQLADTALTEGETLTVSFSASDPDDATAATGNSETKSLRLATGDLETGGVKSATGKRKSGGAKRGNGDPKINGLTFTASNLPAFATFVDSGNGSGSITFSPNHTQSGVYGNIQIKVTDSDPNALSDSSSFQLTVHEFNRAPTLTAIPAQGMSEAETLSVAISASDPDTDNSLTLSAANLPTFATFTDNGNGSGTIVFIPDFLQAGSYPNITVTVTDDAPSPLTDQQIFTLTVSDSNRAPVLTAIADQTTDENVPLTINLSAGDADSDNSLTFSVSNLPPFAAFTDNGDGSGSIVFTPGFSAAGSYSNIIVTVTDDAPTPKSAQDAFNLTVNNVNRPPVISALADTSLTEGETLSLAFSASDPDTNNVTFSANNLPAFAAFTDNGDGSGSIAFSPNSSQSGVYQIQIIAIDNGPIPAADTSNFQLTVIESNIPPVIAAIPNQSTDEQSLLDVSVSASDPNNDFVLLSAANLPAFGSFSDNGNGNGNVRFTPGFNDAGNYFIDIIAQDTGDPQMSDTVTFLLTVNGTNRAPSITAVSDQNMDEGDTLEIAIAATDPDGDSLAFSANSLPAFGTIIDNGNGTGLLRFITGPEDAGTYTIEIVATDNGAPPLFSIEPFVLTVNNVNRAPEIVGILDQNMLEGLTLSITASASDPDSDAVTLSVNNLPAFGSFAVTGNGAGTLTFTPGFKDEGVYVNIEVVATDNGSPALSSSEFFTLTVVDNNTPPLAQNDAVQTDEDSSLTIAALANDSDPNGDSLRVSALLAPNIHGVVSILPGDTTIFYQPETDFNGVDQFQYVIDDGKGLLDTATVSVTVNPVNDPPVLTGLPDSVSFAANQSVNLDVFSAVSDVETADSLLTYVFSAAPDTLLFDFDDASGLLTVSAKNPAAPLVVQATVTVSDPDGGSVSKMLQVRLKTPVGIGPDFENTIPKEFVLLQNFPNPFNPATKIRFGLPVASRVKIEIFNLLGQRVAVLLDETKTAGYHLIEFRGESYASGLYIYVIQAGNFRAMRKMILLK